MQLDKEFEALTLGVLEEENYAEKYESCCSLLNCKLPKKLKVDIRVCMVQCIVYLIDKSLLGDGDERLKLQQ